MNTGIPKTVAPASGRAVCLTAGEIVYAKFNGSPLIAVHASGKRSGGLARLSGARLDQDLKTWVASLSVAFDVPKAELEVKVLSSAAQEVALKKVLEGLGFARLSFAVFGNADAAECYFYPETGRLRVARTEASSLARSTQGRDREPSIARAQVNPPTRFEPKRKIRVLIVDDSRTIRQILRRIVELSPNLEVAGEVDRPSAVEKAIEELKPDVMTLDIKMPEMTGVELLRKMLPKRFVPTIMISSLSIDEGDEVLNALELGAVDYIQKPSASEIATLTPVIHECLIGAAQVKKRPRSARSGNTKSGSGLAAKSMTSSSPARSTSAPIRRGATGPRLLAIGASTGGTEAIKSIFTCLPADIPPIAVVQHIPPHFSAAFAKRLNELCPFEVREAKDGDEFLPGLALIAPGGLHLEVVKEGSRLLARVFDGEPVNRFKPSVDVLFNSVAKVIGGQATGVLLTGMGSDGAKGLLQLKKQGAFTIAQDEESCVVYGMPRAAIEMGAATLVKSLEEMAGTILTRPAAA